MRQDTTVSAMELTSGLQDLMGTVIPTGSRCLDVSCGQNGTIRRWLLKRRCQYVGADISQASALPFEDESFDAALLIGVVDQLVAPGLAAIELHRVLQPGGVLLVTAPNTSYWRHRLTRAVHHRDPLTSTFSPASLRSLLLQGGFSLVGIEGQDGSIVRDLPVARRLWNGRASKPYRVAERLLPSLLGSEVGAFAVRGAAPTRLRGLGNPHAHRAAGRESAHAADEP